ncbi:unnamed protein product [Schistosoma turkestanicum]|nr:unnamed protein product [Schistosoma turkestanicum]
MLLLNLNKFLQIIMIIYTTDNLIHYEHISSSSTTKRSLNSHENINQSAEYLKMNSLQRTHAKYSQKFKHSADQSNYYHQQQHSTVQIRLPSVEECISDQYNYSVNKGCLCYLFQSTGLSNGTFEFITNRHAQILRDSMSNCIIYTFVGDLKEIVHIRLLDFNLSINKETFGRGDKCTTQFTVYHRLDRAELMRDDQPDYRLCGQELNQLPVQEFYSTGRVLIIELDQITNESQKILGLFEFLDKDTYQTDGIHIQSTKCDQLFFSSSHKNNKNNNKNNNKSFRTNSNPLLLHQIDQLNRNPPQRMFNNDQELFFLQFKSNGKFFSPNYPQFYHNNNVSTMLCKYYFLAHSNERIIIKLNNVQLWSNQNCHSTLQRDTIHVHEIATSLFNTNDATLSQLLHKLHENAFIYQLKKQLLFLCGSKDHIEIISDHPLLMLTLQTHVNSLGARGFEGIYQFLSKTQSSHNHDNDKELFQDPGILEFMNTETDSTIKKQTIPQIKHYWLDPLKPRGIIKSPNYPLVYPQNMRLLYIFNIPEGKLLRLKFSSIQLGNNYIPSTKCTQLVGDRIELYEYGYLNNNTPQLILCGTSAVPQEKIIRNQRFQMNHVYINFITDHLTNQNELGFILSYEYANLNGSVPNENQYIADNDDDNNNHNRFMPIRQDLSDNSDDDDDPCQFTIKSYGKESTGYLHIPDYLIKTKKSFNLNNCKWKLEGGYGQRIQIRFIRHLNTVQQSNSFPSGQMTSIQRNDDFVQHDQEFNDLIQRQKQQKTDMTEINEDELTFTPSASSSSSASSFLNSLKCPTSITLELINYRANLLTTNNDINKLLNNKLNPHNMLKQNYEALGVDPLSITQPSSSSSASLSRTDSMESTPSDPVRLCAGDFMNYSPASKGFMSGNIPRLDIILKINQSTNNNNDNNNNNIHNYNHNNITDRRNLEQNVNRNQPFNLGYDVQYKFVTDYGVTSSSGNQRKPSCYFEFCRSQSITGNFSSPNYPGLYPIDVICEYRFSGVNVRRIDISFVEFDVESTSKTCMDDTMGDNVEISSCYSTELLSSPKRRFCHKQNPLNPFKVQWHEPCVNLKFFSNGMYVRTGFFGVYEFHDAGQQCKRINKLLVTFLCFIVNSLLFLLT